MIILLLFSALAGIVTVLSPCILPILPVLLSAGVGRGRQRAYGIIIGLIVSFAFFTLSLTAIVHATGISPDLLRYAAIALIIIFGLTMLFPQLGNRFAAMTSGIANLGILVQDRSSQVDSGFLSGLMLGTALGLLWTPCAGPILATITTLVATSAVTWNVVLITLAYSTGAALPMFLIMYGGNRIISSTKILAGYSESIRQFFGGLMIAGALAIAFHVDVVLQQFTVHYFPMLNVENNQLLNKELMALNQPQNPSFSFEGNKKPQAPDFVGISEWINSPALSMEDLRGHVVLIDFWTYSCINCVRTLPHLKQWYATYRDLGFVIVGVHTPEFEFEKIPENVKNAVTRFGITYPVALDNKYQTWQRYNNHYWPAHYLVDQNGIVQYHHFGEGNYAETENAIRTLLGLEQITTTAAPEAVGPLTPETYLGYERGSQYQTGMALKYDQIAVYDYQEPLAPDHVGLKGSWFVDAQFIRAEGTSRLDLNFMANRVYLVMSSPTPQLIAVLLDDQPVPAKYYTADINKRGQILVHEARMYDILDLKGENGRHKLTLQFPNGVQPYVFTFGKGEK